MLQSPVELCLVGFCLVQQYVEIERLERPSLTAAELTTCVKKAASLGHACKACADTPSLQGGRSAGAGVHRLVRRRREAGHL